MVVGEFLVFREALMLKTGGGWRVWLKSSCFPSFWFSGKGFRAGGKEFGVGGKKSDDVGNFGYGKNQGESESAVG